MTRKPNKPPRARKPRGPRVVAKVRFDLSSDLDEYLRNFATNAGDIAQALLVRKPLAEQQSVLGMMKANPDGVLTIAVGFTDGKSICLLLDFAGHSLEEIILPNVPGPALH